MKTFNLSLVVGAETVAKLSEEIFSIGEEEILVVIIGESYAAIEREVLKIWDKNPKVTFITTGKHNKYHFMDLVSKTLVKRSAFRDGLLPEKFNFLNYEFVD